MAGKALLLDASRTSQEWFEEYERIGRAVWEKFPSETLVMYKYFVAYRDMGNTRSLRGLRERMVGKPVDRRRGNTTSTISAYSSRHCWIERAKAYDAYMDQALAEREEKVQSMEPVYWSTRREQLREKRHRIAERVLERVHDFVFSPKFTITNREEAKRFADWALTLADKANDTRSHDAVLGSDLAAHRKGSHVPANQNGQFDPEALSDKDLFDLVVDASPAEKA